MMYSDYGDTTLDVTEDNKLALCSVPTKMVPFLGNRFSRTAPGVDSGGTSSRHWTFRHLVTACKEVRHSSIVTITV